MSKKTTLIKAAKYSEKLRRSGKNVGFVAGSFDILHMGHINLFKFAKKHVDFLIVGVDSDKTIRSIKGKDRPINNSRLRLDFLSELSSVDLVFLINDSSFEGSEKSLNLYKKLINKLNPTHIFTHATCDVYAKQKIILAKKIGITCLIDKSEEITHSGKIIEKLRSEF